MREEREPVADSQLSFGPFELGERLGVGGMAEVHAAVRRSVAGFERGCALKRMLPELATRAMFVTKFLREARLTSTLRHPNVRAIFELGEVDGVYYMDLELVDGVDLLAVLRRAGRENEPLPMEVALTILWQLCEGIKHLHTGDQTGAGAIVHGDISPTNVMVSFAGQLKLIDLGIAESVEEAGRDHGGQIQGKLAYLAPEAFRGEGVDVRADLFSIGVVAHELLTTRRLFRAESRARARGHISLRALARPSVSNPDVPRYVDDWVMRALEPAVEDRWQTAEDMLAALEKFRWALSVPAGTAHVAAWMGELFKPSGDRRKPVPAVRRHELDGHAAQVDANTATMSEGTEHLSEHPTEAKSVSELVAVGKAHDLAAEARRMYRDLPRSIPRRSSGRMARGTSQPKRERSSSPALLSAELVPQRRRSGKHAETPLPELLASMCRPDRSVTVTIEQGQQQPLIRSSTRRRRQERARWVMDVDAAIANCLASSEPAEMAAAPPVVPRSAQVSPRSNQREIATSRHVRWLALVAGVLVVAALVGYALLPGVLAREPIAGTLPVEPSRGLLHRDHARDAGSGVRRPAASATDGGVTVMPIEAHDVEPSLGWRFEPSRREGAPSDVCSLSPAPPAPSRSIAESD